MIKFIIDINTKKKSLNNGYEDVMENKWYYINHEHYEQC